jgi:hypothetical protein
MGELGQVRVNIGKATYAEPVLTKHIPSQLGEGDTKVAIASTLAGPARCGFNSKGREPLREGVDGRAKVTSRENPGYEGRQGEAEVEAAILRPGRFHYQATSCLLHTSHATT